MSKPLIRFAKRSASWDATTSDDELLDTEFRDRDGGADLHPSVYEIDPQEVVQAFSEHSTMREPPSSTVGVDLRTSREVTVTPGKTGFPLTMRAHREIMLVDRDDLLVLVREVRGALESRRYPVTREQVRSYAQDRLNARDQGWERARSDEGAKKWLRKIIADFPT